jgi:hypothetical protein
MTRAALCLLQDGMKGKVAGDENGRSYIPILKFWKQIYFTSVAFEANPGISANEPSTTAKH